MSLWNKLNVLLPEVLSPDAAQALNGTKLLAKVRPLVGDHYAEGTLRQHFSDMAKDASTVIAKVSEGHGYYLRASAVTLPAPTSTLSAASVPTTPMFPVQALISGTRETQREEKFRSIVIRYAELENQQFPLHVEHTKASKREAGVNQWKFPDLVLVRWEVGKLTEQGYYKLDQDLLAVRTSLGEPPFKLHSLELKVALNLSSFRENFFQCLSNSKWAHQAVLAVALPVDDKTLRDELARLANSYEILIVSYGLTGEFLDALPGSSDIRKMNDSVFESEVSPKIAITTFGSAKERPTLDWEHVNDLRSLSSDFIDLFEWTAYCLNQKRAYSFADYEHIRKIQKKT